MICPLYLVAKSNPDDIFIIDGAKQWTYQDWDRQTQGIVEWLNEKKISKGFRIAVQQRSPFSTVSWMMACARLGVIIAILSDRETPESTRMLLSINNVRLIDSQTLDPPPIHSVPVEISLRDPFTMLFTSGSTGRAKAAVHCFENHWSSAIASAKNISFNGEDRWLLSLSLWHIGGLAILFRTLLGKAKAIVKNSTDSLSKQIEENQITHLSVVPLQLERILKEPHDHRLLKHILIGGGPIPFSLLQKAHANNLPIHCTYGMTELSSQLTTTPFNADLDILQSAGAPLEEWQVIISHNGEICAKGPSLFLGYWNGELVESPLDANGYFHTKDIGVFRNSLLFVIGRKDQMFISGGENIHPEEIEQILCSVVDTAIVVSIPSEQYGRRPVAFLKGEWRLEEIDTLLQNQLPSFKHPDHFLPWPENISPHKASRSSLQQLAISILCQ